MKEKLKTEFDFITNNFISSKQEKKIKLLVLKYFGVNGVKFKYSIKRSKFKVIVNEYLNNENKFSDFMYDVKNVLKEVTW